MYLKSMDIFGFKSFAERTKIIFEPGVTVIVGPNGCGKSNIVDSVKWVLGEKQAKNIRGERMEDVIFTGTEQRKPVSLAEVSISIDNAEKVLNFDSDSVTVTRRLFRDGESEYLINKSPVRLKDIEELFMDTGIGKSAYSVMEQGKIDMILSSKAEDRRYIFEEAAGISKYKSQKKESLRKLQDTSDNLERINDIIKEIEREKDLKGKQAEKTKIYMALKNEHADNDIKYNLIRYLDLNRKKARINDEVEKLKREKEELTARVARVSSEHEKNVKQMNDLQLMLFQLDKELDGSKREAEYIDSETGKNRRLINEQAARKSEIENNIRERIESLKAKNDERDRSRQSAVDLRNKINDDKERLKDLSETRKKKIESIKNARTEIEDHKQAIKTGEERLVNMRNDLEAVIKRLVDAIDRRKAEMVESENERQSVRQKISDGVDGIRLRINEALLCLEKGMVAEAADHIKAINIDVLKDDILRFEGYEDGFRSILFDKAGIHAEKEAIDVSIKNTMIEIENRRSAINSLEEHIRREQSALDDVISMISRIEKDLSRDETERDWVEKNITSLTSQINDIEKQIGMHRDETVRCNGLIEKYQSEINEWEAKLVEFSQKSETLKKSINDLAEKRSDIDSRIVNSKNLSKKDAESLNKIGERISGHEQALFENKFRIEGVEEHLWTEYERRVSDLEKIKVDDAQSTEIQKNIQDIKKKIQDLGPINNLAIEEYKDLKKRFEFYISQKKDIEKARGDILSVIEDINRTSVEMFMSTFKSIRKNFSEIFRQRSEGGDAAIELTEPENVLESGIEIGCGRLEKKLKNINLLSGGERALTAVALLFATYMEKPSPFCFLDEIDAPLDEENIGRFVKMLREFSRSTQFIIVTHNKKTMCIGESIYGITMEEPGISKVVSLRMEKVEAK